MYTGAGLGGRQLELKWSRGTLGHCGANTGLSVSEEATKHPGPVSGRSTSRGWPAKVSCRATDLSSIGGPAVPSRRLLHCTENTPTRLPVGVGRGWD